MSSSIHPRYGVSGKRSFSCRTKFSFDYSRKCVRLQAPVYIYYGLTNFYQNHRRYVKSRDDVQLLGKLDAPPSSDCSPYTLDPVSNKPIAPCGAIANSMFSGKIELLLFLSIREKFVTRTSFADELELFSKVHQLQVPVSRTGIAWPSDKQIKFRNPPGSSLKEGAKLK